MVHGLDELAKILRHSKRCFLHTKLYLQKQLSSKKPITSLFDLLHCVFSKPVALLDSLKSKMISLNDNMGKQYQGFTAKLLVTNFGLADNVKARYQATGCDRK